MVEVRVRRCCCALHTFVRIACILLCLVHVVSAATVTIWHLVTPTSPDGSDVNVRRVAFVLVLLFSVLGIAVNLLVLLGVHRNQRSLLLPWLVFQLMVILGQTWLNAVHKQYCTCFGVFHFKSWLIIHRN